MFEQFHWLPKDMINHPLPDFLQTHEMLKVCFLFHFKIIQTRDIRRTKSEKTNNNIITVCNSSEWMRSIENPSNPLT